MHRRKFFLLFVMVMLVLAVFPSAASAEAIVDGGVYKSTFTSTSEGFCLDELITVERTNIFFVQLVENDNTYHLTWHDQLANVHGVGWETGTQYTGGSVWNMSGNAQIDDMPYVVTATIRGNLVSQGPGENYIYYDTYHVTINANGEVVVDNDDFRIECR